MTSSGNTDIRILVVDDEPVIVVALQRVLTVNHYSVRTALDAESALPILSEWSPHVVIVDLKLPGMSGLDLIRAGQETAGEAVFVLTSGYAGTDQIVDSLAGGAFAFLPKPFTFEEAAAVAWRASRLARLDKSHRIPRPAMASKMDFLGVQSWVRMLEDQTAELGLTDVFVRTVGSPTAIGLPTVGFPLVQGDPFVHLTDARPLTYIGWAAMGGRIIDTNVALADDPTLVSKDPFGEGWIARIRPIDAAGDLRKLSGL